MMKNPASLLILALLFAQSLAGVEREQTFHIDGLSSEPVTVDIHSEITGIIKWIYTDDQQFNLNVKICAENERNINSTGINLKTTNSSVNLMISENHFPISPSPVTGTGNALHIPTHLVWFLALLIGWNNPMAVLLTVLVYGLSPGSADETYYISNKTVQVEVKAPRRILYQTINLYINGGKLRVTNWTAEGAVLPACKTETALDGCPNCCHGHGVCTQNQCMCDNGYDQDSSCALSKRQSVFFSHPFDPRYERTILPNEEVVTLSHAFQYIQDPPYLKDPDVYAMEIQSRHITFSHIVIVFHSDGLVEEIIDLNSSKKSVLKLRRSRMQECLIRLKADPINLKLNICDNYNPLEVTVENVDQRTSVINQGKSINREIENRRRSKGKGRQKMKSQFDYNFIEIPVRIERCGYNSPDKSFVYFQLFKDNIDAIYANYIERKMSIDVSESIILLSHTNNDGTAALRLPDNKVPLGTDDITSKCKMTMSLQSRICSSSNLETLRIVCDNIVNHTDTKHSTPSHIFRTAELCTFVLKTVTIYCEKSDSIGSSYDVSCLSNNRDSFNLFSNGTYHIRPIAIFPDEKRITGRESKVEFGDHKGIERNELAIIDNEAEFKIVKISVIPTDPVPHDIYQVKLDYACATRDTVIKMTVYGSDFYSNDVVCHGITSCNCCILHAAGAPNAVVDHVTINVTDNSRNYSHIREMVVVF